MLRQFVVFLPLMIGQLRKVISGIFRVLQNKCESVPLNIDTVYTYRLHGLKRSCTLQVACRKAFLLHCRKMISSLEVQKKKISKLLPYVLRLFIMHTTRKKSDIHQILTSLVKIFK